MAIKRPPDASALLTHAMSLEAFADAQIWAVHVVGGSTGDTDASPTLMNELERSEEWMRAALVDAGLGSRGARPLVVVGDPAQEILSAIRALDIETVLIGSAPGEESPTGVGRQVQMGAACPVVFRDLESGRVGQT